MYKAAAVCSCQVTNESIIYHDVQISHKNAEESSLINCMKGIFAYNKMQMDAAKEASLKRECSLVNAAINISRDIQLMQHRRCELDLPEKDDLSFADMEELTNLELEMNPKLLEKSFQKMLQEENGLYDMMHTMFSNPDIMKFSQGYGLPAEDLEQLQEVFAGDEPSPEIQNVLNQVKNLGSQLPFLYDEQQTTSPSGLINSAFNWMGNAGSNYASHVLPEELDCSIGNQNESSSSSQDQPSLTEKMTTSLFKYFNYNNSSGELNTDYQNAFSINITDLYNNRKNIHPSLSESFKAEWDELTTRDKVHFSSIVGRDALFNDQGLGYIQWKPGDSIESFAEILKQGPLLVLGTLGLATYMHEPTRKAEKVADKAVFGWGSKAEKVPAIMNSLSLIVGVNPENNLVFYLDPADPKGRILGSLYTTLGSKLVDRWMRDAKDPDASEFAVQLKKPV